MSRLVQDGTRIGNDALGGNALGSNALGSGAFANDALAAFIGSKARPERSELIDRRSHNSRALIRVDGSKGRSLSENMAHYFYRLTWRTPLYRLRLKGRSPLRLMTRPEDPLPGDVRRGRALMRGAFLFNGLKLPLAGLDYHNLRLPDNYLEYLHSFAWLRDLDALDEAKKSRVLAEKLALNWLSSHSEQVSDPAWRVDITARRLLNIASHAHLLLSSPDLVYRSRVLLNFAHCARHLDLAADKSPDGLPQLSAWIGVVAASLLLPDGEPRRIFGEAGLKKAVEQFMGEDGGAVSRSLLSQIGAIELLTQLCAVYEARGDPPSPAIEYALARAVPALLGVTHSDGSLASWQGAPAISAKTLNHLIAQTKIRARPHRQALQWGYQRIPAGKTIVVADAGPPPSQRFAQNGCASTLAFEMSHGDYRLVVSCGGAAMVGGHIPAKLANGLRATAAHSTVCLNNHNSTSILSQGKMGRGVNEVDMGRRESEERTRLEMSHDGYVARYGLVHSRILLVRSDGSELRGEDMLLPEGRKKRNHQPVSCDIRFHLGPDVSPHLTPDGMGVFLKIANGDLWQFRSSAGKLDLDKSIWIDGNGEPQSIWQIVLSSMVDQGGASYSWLFRKT